MALIQRGISTPGLKHQMSSSQYRKGVSSLNDIGTYVNILLNEASSCIWENMPLDKKEHSNSFFFPSFFQQYLATFFLKYRCVKSCTIVDKNI